MRLRAGIARTHAAAIGAFLAGFTIAPGTVEARLEPRSDSIDWFDPMGWSGGSVPTSTDDVSVSRGQTARALASSPLLPDGVDEVAARAIEIGRMDAFGDGLDSGVLLIEGLDLSIGDRLSVGIGSGDDRSSGEVRLSGSARLPSLSVGFATASAADDPNSIGAIVSGLVEIGGDVTGDPSAPRGDGAALISVGSAYRGRADGNLRVAGDLELFGDGETGSLSIGTALSLSSWPDLAGLTSSQTQAAGRAEIGSLSATSLTVGYSQAAGTGIGVLEVAGNVDVSDALVGGLRAGTVPSPPGCQSDCGSRADSFTGTAMGRVHVGGNLYPALSLIVGSTASQAASTEVFEAIDYAEGSVVVDGIIKTFERGLLRVASGSGAASTVGYVEAEGIEDMATVSIGTHGTNYASGGTSHGAVEIRSGGLRHGPLSRPVIAPTLSIGTTEGVSGRGVGRLDVQGDVGPDYARVRIGTQTGSGGEADGELVLHDGVLGARFVYIGVAEGGSARGRLELERGLADIRFELRLGDGATISLHVDGHERSSGYGAIDVALASLDGILELVFDSALQLRPGDVFDLIRTDVGGGIEGSFDEIRVMGLDRDRLHFTVESEVEENGAYEVYRATVIPEPGSAILLAMGLFGLSGATSRRGPTRGRGSWTREQVMGNGRRSGSDNDSNRPRTLLRIVAPPSISVRMQPVPPTQRRKGSRSRARE